MTRNKADKEPTKTLIVLQTLVSADDFITAAQLIERLSGKVNTNQISASLHHLKKRHAVDCMESDGRLWWYSTPDLDDRSRVLEEKVVETSPRRRRGSIQTGDPKPKQPSTSGIKVVSLGSKLSQSLREANEIADRIRSKKS